MQMGRNDNPRQLNGKGLRTRLKVLGKSTNGAVTVLRQRLCEALELSAAAPAAAAASAATALSTLRKGSVDVDAIILSLIEQTRLLKLYSCTAPSLTASFI
jgi:hypothetical protein